eukprot:6628678-Alexandrium_andersonii.AAC.1
MSASLVGSEMCIRDSRRRSCPSDPSAVRASRRWRTQVPGAGSLSSAGTVSYTHLTLPTICSV